MTSFREITKTERRAIGKDNLGSSIERERFSLVFKTIENI